MSIAAAMKEEAVCQSPLQANNAFMSIDVPVVVAEGVPAIITLERTDVTVGCIADCTFLYALSGAAVNAHALFAFEAHTKTRCKGS